MLTFHAIIQAMTIRWGDVKGRAKAKGWDNAHQLAQGAGLSYPVATRLWRAKQSIDRIEVDTLEKLAKAFGLKSPWALLEYTED